MERKEPNDNRGRFLGVATGFVAGVGVMGAAIPFIGSWQPSAKAKAIGAPVQVNVDKIEPGEMVSVAWQGKPVFLLRRMDRFSLFGGCWVQLSNTLKHLFNVGCFCWVWKSLILVPRCNTG